MRIKFLFARGEELQYLSHLEGMRSLQRSMIRAALPLAYSQGFNPQPRLSIAAPLPVGITAAAEPAEVYLTQRISLADFSGRLQPQLPDGFQVKSAVEAAAEEPPLMQSITAAGYEVRLQTVSGNAPDWKQIEAGVNKLNALPEIMVTRAGKKGLRQKDIRPFVHRVHLVTDMASRSDAPATNAARPETLTGPYLELLLQTGSQGGAKPLEVLHFLVTLMGHPINDYLCFIHRFGLFTGTSGSLQAVSF